MGQWFGQWESLRTNGTFGYGPLQWIWKFGIGLSRKKYQRISIMRHTTTASNYLIPHQNLFHWRIYRHVIFSVNYSFLVDSATSVSAIVHQNPNNKRVICFIKAFLNWKNVITLHDTEMWLLCLIVNEVIVEHKFGKADHHYTPMNIVY